MGKRGHNNNRWCPVCDGRGGWDARNNKLRFREEGDTADTYITCVYCGTGNVVGKVIPRNVDGANT